MPYKQIKGGVCAPKGFLANAVAAGDQEPRCGAHRSRRHLFSTEPTVSAGTFTTNKVKAAPVRVTQTHLRARELRAIIANSGNANACTGVHGINDARPWPPPPPRPSVSASARSASAPPA